MKFTIEQCHQNNNFLQLDYLRRHFYNISVLRTAEESFDALDRRDDIERRRECATFIKIGYPQFGAGKLPLCVCVILSV